MKKKLIFLYLLSFVSLSIQAQEISGVVYPNKELDLALGVNGTIAQVEVKEGENVSIGQLLLVLDNSIQTLEKNRRYLMWKDDSERETLQQRLNILNKKWLVLQELYKTAGSISKDELDNLKLDILQTQGRIDQLRMQKKIAKVEYNISEQEIKQRKLTAPISGRVTKIHLKKGEWAQIGEPIMTIVDTKTLSLKFNVTSQVISDLALGQELSVKVNKQKPVTGKLNFISSVADPASGLVEIKVLVKNDKIDRYIRPGTKVKLIL